MGVHTSGLGAQHGFTAAPDPELDLTVLQGGLVADLADWAEASKSGAEEMTQKPLSASFRVLSTASHHFIIISQEYISCLNGHRIAWASCESADSDLVAGMGLEMILSIKFPGDNDAAGLRTALGIKSKFIVTVEVL